MSQSLKDLFKHGLRTMQTRLAVALDLDLMATQLVASISEAAQCLPLVLVLPPPAGLN